MNVIFALQTHIFFLTYTITLVTQKDNTRRLNAFTLHFVIILHFTMNSEQSIREFRAITKRVSSSTTIALWVCLVTTICLFIASALVPPYGVIDPSMFKAAGFLSGFATLFVLREAIKEGFGFKFTHGDTTLEVTDTDSKKDE